VIVAVVAMVVVKPALMEEILVVTVRDYRMSRMRGSIMPVTLMRVQVLMLRASMVRRTAIGIFLADLDAMDLDDIIDLVFEVTRIQVVDVFAMPNRQMSTSRSMSMCHCPTLLSGYCGYYNECAVSRSGTERLDLGDFRQRPSQCLAPYSSVEARLEKQRFYFSDGIEDGVTVKDAFGAVGQVVLTEWTVSINEADNQRTARPKNATRLSQHGQRRIDEADGRHNQRVVETPASERQCFGGASDGHDPPACGAGEHL
jgi:hypothetical protein